ncbi:MAG: hypothetical protein MUF49_07945 [Oculatellaceae cyanobacterium Prado106]|nr:hypothetical protein [Oculatellaceae cyanobacterium Prado106]
MSESVHYITNEQGERVGVMLDLATYQRMADSLATDPDRLSGLSMDELQALANCKLSIAEQTRLNDLLVQNAASQLSPDETEALEQLLNEADQLTILKARAQYTLQLLGKMAEAS